MNDKDNLKQHLERYLKSHGIEFDASGNKFICPFHNDTEPSMGIVPDSNGTQAYCFVCGGDLGGVDIFRFGAHFYGLDIKRDFPEIKKRIASELGQPIYDAPPPAKQQCGEKPTAVPVTLSVEAAREIYTGAAIVDLGKFIFGDHLAPGKDLVLENVWPCKNESGAVEFVEVRFHPSCFADGKKRTSAIWWNGKRLKAKNCPHGIYGRDLLAAVTDKPVLIVEGPKCWDEAAKKLPDFVAIAWNGGANGQKRLDFSPLKGRTVYIYPDDDEAGEKSARATAKLLHDIVKEIIIVKPLPEARAIKAQKADIVEALQAKPPEEVAAYIKSHTPPVEQPQSNDPYRNAGAFLASRGFFKIYDKKSVGFYSTREERAYNFTEIQDKYAEDKIGGLNPAKAAKMIDNLDPAYPVYRLVKSFGSPPLYMGRGQKDNEYIINCWRGFQYPLKEIPASDSDADKEVEFVKQHIRDIICGGNDDDYNYFSKWVAHLFQKPDIKPGVAIFAHSESQGTGKSLIFEQLIPNMLGVDITRVFSNEEQISEKFNAWLFESLYVVFSEQSFYNNAENIKSWITDPNQSRRDMGTESRQERSYARFVICTNKENAFKFDKSERRMFVLNVSDKMVGNWLYFNRLGAAVNSVAVLNRMARFFSTINITNFNPFDLPKSDKKAEIIDAEKHPVIDFFEMVAWGEEKRCEPKLCSEIDPFSTENYHKSPSLYNALLNIGVNGEMFIERKKLFDVWKDGLGRNRKETANRFTKLIKNAYPVSKVEVLNEVVRDGKKTNRTPVIIIKQEFYSRDI